jgi:hypothetical protein
VGRCSLLFQHKQSWYCYCDVFHSNHGDMFLLPSLFLLRPCLPVALGVARLWLLVLLPDLLRSAVFLLLVMLNGTVELGLIGSKGSLLPAVLCHRGLWYVNLSVLAVDSFAVSYLYKYWHIIFLLFGFVPVRGFAG